MQLLTQIYTKTREILQALWKILVYSISGKPRTTTSCCDDRMKVIPGYWDPRQLCFIEEPEAVNLLELQVVRASRAGSYDSATAGEAVSAGGKAKKN